LEVGAVLAADQHQQGNRRCRCNHPTSDNDTEVFDAPSRDTH
jgi:hypothetical protein